MRYIMSERIENAIVAAVGACFIFFSGWGFLAIADAIYKVINYYLEELWEQIKILNINQNFAPWVDP